MNEILSKARLFHKPVTTRMLFFSKLMVWSVGLQEPLGGCNPGKLGVLWNKPRKEAWDDRATSGSRKARPEPRLESGDSSKRSVVQSKRSVVQETDAVGCPVVARGRLAVLHPAWDKLDRIRRLRPFCRQKTFDSLRHGAGKGSVVPTAPLHPDIRTRRFCLAPVDFRQWRDAIGLTCPTKTVEQDDRHLPHGVNPADD